MGKNGRSKNFDERVFLLLESIKGKSTICVSEIVAIFGSLTHYFLALILSLPFLQPIVIPGLSSLVGILIMISGGCLLVDKPLWVPNMMKQKALPIELIQHGCAFWNRCSYYCNGYIKPRCRYITKEPLIRRLNGMLIILNALLLSLPLPIPGTNLLPGYAIFTLSAAAIRQDGIFMLIGYLLSGIAASFFLMLLRVPFGIS